MTFIKFKETGSVLNTLYTHECIVLILWMLVQVVTLTEKSLVRRGRQGLDVSSSSMQQYLKNLKWLLSDGKYQLFCINIFSRNTKSCCHLQIFLVFGRRRQCWINLPALPPIFTSDRMRRLWGGRTRSIGTYHTLSRAWLHFGPCYWSTFLNVYLKEFFFSYWRK